MALTEKWLRQHSGKKSARVRELSDGVGLSIRANPTGKLVFQMRYAYKGVCPRLDLGTYPEMTLATARTENERLRHELKQGGDPKVILEVERHLRYPAATIEDLFRTWWYESLVAEPASLQAAIRRSFETHLFPRIGSTAPASVALETWLVVLSDIARESPSEAATIFVNAKANAGLGQIQRSARAECLDRR